MLRYRYRATVNSTSQICRPTGDVHDAPKFGFEHPAADAENVAPARYPDLVIEASESAAPSTPDLTERVRRLLDGEPGVLVAYLYGSHARSRVGPLSDVDVAVLLDDDNEERRLELTAAITHAVAPARADVVVLNDAPLPLAYRVLRDGTVLVSHDDRARVEHWVRTVDRYLDMAPARRALAAGTRNRLREGRFGRR
ncbi:MAG: type VII toxin-antitoxin system MntA family adenylyltransferase antitoxin [Pseudonocardiaceae bacterium]